MREPTVAIPNEADWEQMQLAEMCSVISRGRAPTYVERSNVLAIGQRCVTDGGFDPGPARPHSEQAMNGVLQPELGDVLLNSTGTGTIGRSSVFDGKGRFVVDGHVTVLRLRPEVGVGRWLSDLLRTHWGQTHLETQCYSGSTNQVELSRTRLAATRLPVPPLHEQRGIAKILDTVDEAIRKTEEIIAKLEQVKQGLLHDLLTRGIDDNGELRDPDRHAEQFKHSPLGRIPKTWEVPRIGDGIDFITDYRGATPPYSTEGIPVISAENVGDGRVKSTTKWVTPDVYRRTSTRGFPEAGDTIFTTEAPVGEVARVPGDQPYRLTRRVLALRPCRDWWNKHFLFWFIYYRSASGAWDAFMHGSTVPRILKPDILARRVARPPLSEQERVEAVLDEHEDRLHREQKSVAKLRLLKRGLMEDLLTGRVRVTLLLEEAPE